MDEFRIVIDMAILLLIAGVFAVLFARIKMPPILGYITAGIIIGPSMFPEVWVEGSTVSLLSSLGIVLLLFYIGLETDIAKLQATGSKILIIVLIQMPIMVAVGYLLGIIMGMDFVQSIFLGAIISGTSTAVVVGVLKTAKHIDADMAKLIVTITIFEDVGQVLILTMAAPLLAGDAPALGSTVNMIIGLILFIGMAMVFGMTLVPRLINWIGKRYSPEIVLIVAVGLCFAMAAISASIGLDVAIGAFLMGMMIAISKFGHKLMQKVEPVKELFMAVFFISIGMQVSPALIVDNFGLAAIMAVAFIIAKIVTISLGSYLVNMTARDSLLVATSLLAMGEFAFIIAKAALDAGVVTGGFYAAVIGAALITMFVAPVITRFQPKMFDAILRILPNRLLCSLRAIDDVHASASNGLAEDSPARAGIKNAITLIFVDIIVLITVMLVFNHAEGYTETFEDLASGLNLLGDELLLILLIIIMAPIIYNMLINVRKIARHLTVLAVESPRTTVTNPKAVYKIFVNLAYVAMIMVAVALVITLMPNLIMVSPLGVLVSVFAGLIILLLTWDTVSRAYVRFCAMVTGGMDNEEEWERR